MQAIAGALAVGAMRTINEQGKSVVKSVNESLIHLPVQIEYLWKCPLKWKWPGIAGAGRFAGRQPGYFTAWPFNLTLPMNAVLAGVGKMSGSAPVQTSKISDLLM